MSNFISDCILYEATREKFREQIFLQLGVREFTKELLLADEEDDPYKEYRRLLSDIVDDFIEASKRFD